ncbi:MAG: mevalonate kinase [Caldilineaceae bacterium]|nr:mevalonate kinase [Caldilineaceae bacterium]
MITATAPGKIILIGEHAVVYGRPAIAVPVWEKVAQATITATSPGTGCMLVAPDIARQWRLATTNDDEPLALVTRLTLAQLNATPDPDWLIEVHSQLPIASGLGSGAALSTALVRAIYAHLGQPPDPAQVSALVYESERHYHGTPSGIDNTVIAYGMPVWFIKGQPPTTFLAAQPLTLVIADSGIAAPTKETVGDVRRGWQAHPARYEAWFDEIGAIAHAARQAIEAGAQQRLGELFDQNQALLAKLAVSSPRLDHLIDVARQAGALGAKLSGGGRGGNLIAIVEPAQAAVVATALATAGARQVIVTTVAP